MAVRHSIRTLGVPTRRGSIGAFIVIPARSSTASMNGNNKVTGAPGTVAVPSPRPASLNDGNFGGRYNQPSDVAPDVIFPSIYVVDPEGLAIVAHRSANVTGGPGPYLMPIQSERPSAVPLNFAKRSRIGGQTVTSARRPFLRWPTYNRGASN